MTQQPLAAAIALIVVVGIAVGIWAEFADLNQTGLLAVGVPVLLVATSAVALSTNAPPMRRAVLTAAAGAALGWLLLTVSEGLYLAIHLSRGRDLDFEGADSQAGQALALLSIHMVVGVVLGLIVGAAVALIGLVLHRRRTATSGETRYDSATTWKA